MVYRTKNDAPIEFLHYKWNVLREHCLIEGNLHKANNGLYRDASIEVLDGIYKGNCAYCERKRGFELQIDHYRPRKKRDYGPEPKYHQPGYFWLTYE